MLYLLALLTYYRFLVEADTGCLVLARSIFIAIVLINFLFVFYYNDIL